MTAINPDALAELEREQAFLLRSLDDLDTELAAGDMSADDHAQLADDYTRRLAEVARSIDAGRVAFAEIDNKLSRRQLLLAIIGVATVGLLAGLFLARASGFRSPTDSLSGDIRQSSTGLLAEADTLTREGRWEEAIEVYDEVLDIAPSNAEAFAYRGWLHSRLGEPDQALIDIDEAIAIDPNYPDARVFRAIVLDNTQRFDEAAEEIAVLDTLDASEQIIGLVESFGLRASITGGRIVERHGTPGEAVDLAPILADESGRQLATLDDVVDAGVLLLDLDPELSLRIFAAALEEDPDNFTALVAAGNIQTNPAIIAQSRVTGEQGLAQLDRALELVPGDSQVLLSRASARALLGDRDGARADFDLIDQAALPEALQSFYVQLADDLAEP